MTKTQQKPKKKGYDFTEVEPRIMQFWEKEKIFKFNTTNTEKEIFSFDTPPPTISGRLHMGHVFGDAQQDFIARYKRMKGFNVLNPFGTDNNGLPTLKLVEKEKKVNSKDMTREEFIELCQKTIKEEFIPQFLNDAKRLGISADWDIFYSTIDRRSRRISQKSFIDLYKMGREYRTECPSLWCTKCQTTIAQVELEDVDKNTIFNDIVFKIGNQDLIISTTRPELLPACVCVFVNKSDKRYKDIIGKKAKVPLFDFEVPILTDEKANPEKGSGAVMCCTFGDQTDMEWQKAHNLPIKEAISINGRMSSLSGKYENMKPEEARKEIIKDLKENNLLKNQKPLKHAVNVHERCGTPIEFIHSKQWFIKYLNIKEDMLKWGDKLNWYPKHMKNRYDNWVNGLAWDWCISRQIPFGIPFPVWYCKKCDEVIVAKEKDLPVDPLVDKPPVDKCPNCNSTEFIPEKDIINTWATSSLTPTIVKELFKGKPCYNELINNPMSLRPQGHDIISFWLFNTVVKSKLHFNMLPWNDCFINGWMLDPKGKKMSKSKGNIIEPQGMIDKYSADSLRFMAAGCKLGDDLAFQEKDLVTGHKFCNKLWNASKFVFMNLEDYKKTEKEEQTLHKKPDLSLMDKWLLSKLNRTIKISTEAYEEHNFMRNKMDTEKFFWQSFCDNYLEIVKHKLYNAEAKEKESAQYCLSYSLLTVLKLMAPVMPHITEEIYQSYFAKNEQLKSIHLSPWPKFDKKLIDEDIEKTGDLIINIISEVRKFKSQNQLSLKEELSLLEIKADKELQEKLKPALEDLKNTLKLKEIKFSDKGTIDLGELKISIKK
ncbi:MAG: valine--tRNA ligase [Nanoarchaeota archaeon]|nr:valine--tRNA ligase [Nanoarchaeota archaeon]